MWKWEAEGQPKAVVAIVHNVYEHHSRNAWLIQKLRNSGFHVVTGDLPGHGVGGGGEIHDEQFTTYAKYVEKLIAVGLDDNLPLFILGHGMGATFVMRLLQRKKIECAGVVFSSPWLALRHQPPKFSSVLTKFSSSMKLNHKIDIEMLTRNSDLYEEAKQDDFYTAESTVAWYKELQAFMKLVVQNERSIHDIPVLMHIAEDDKISDIALAKKWLIRQELSEFQYKQWKRLYHDVYQEPEREEVYLYTESFMNNVLRSLGYVV
ncbi:alpha/beta hydrolase [Sporosarcina sp. ANT_H38]|uniref:alpha/beta hydrolase n=1 Tax=Sporosarcina sp. ANT_H38 TaxID=2597358 RepID=UPI0011F28990|nr:alpha/beta hydrolase [Sporosarcina sp. ANT_H38]KAA0964802.1 alpha/beta hydrolase [Sporosarcina sp. ANT_H38]